MEGAKSGNFRQWIAWVLGDPCRSALSVSTKISTRTELHSALTLLGYQGIYWGSFHMCTFVHTFESILSRSKTFRTLFAQISGALKWGRIPFHAEKTFNKADD